MTNQLVSPVTEWRETSECTQSVYSVTDYVAPSPGSEEDGGLRARLPRWQPANS